jgi:hypothetical protein
VWDRVECDAAELIGRIVAFPEGDPRVGDLMKNDREDQDGEDEKQVHGPPKLSEPGDLGYPYDLVWGGLNPFPTSDIICG